MKYKDLKKELSETGSKKKQIENNLSELIDRRDDLKETINSAYDTLTDARAKLNIGKGSQSDVDQALEAYQNVKDDLEQITQDIDVHKQSMKLLNAEIESLRTQIQSAGVEYHTNQLTPALDTLRKALTQAEHALQDIKKYSPSIVRDGLDPKSLIGFNPSGELVMTKGLLAGMHYREFHTIETIKSKLQKDDN